MEDVLQELGRKIDKMFEDSSLSQIEWKKEIDQRVDEVRNNLDTLESKTREILGDSERWKEVEDKIRNATNEFRDAVETAFSTKRESSKEPDN
jgi:uncharacterized coiled-coil DUF342 family protein